MTVTAIQGTALHLPLADDSVDLCVTSPPYFALRSYTDGGERYDGQVGSEPTPGEFLDALIAATEEMSRVVKPSGSIFVNLGDKYAGAGYQTPGNKKARPEPGQTHGVRTKARAGGVPFKSLYGLPWRYALRCIDTTQGIPPSIVREMIAQVYAGELLPDACEDIIREYEVGGRNAGLGLILRAEVIWDKPNGLPESVTDRVRRSHETWFHFTRESRYYTAIDTIREPHEMRPQRRPNGRPVDGTPRPDPRQAWSTAARDEPGVDGNPLGKLPGSVWTIPTEPLDVPDWHGDDHYAAFPTEWPRRLILGWSPAGICTVCGEGRRPVIDKSEAVWDGRSAKTGPTPHSPEHNHGTGASSLRMMRERTFAGEACGCTPWHMEPAPTDRDPYNAVLVYDWHLWDAPPTRPSVVLDPFGGTGTTAHVASALGRHGISVDLSAGYSKIAADDWMRRQRYAKVHGVAKPPKGAAPDVHASGTESLFAGLA